MCAGTILRCCLHLYDASVDPLLIGKRIARDPGICADGLIADGVGQ